jgi:hypothetical protein
VVALGGRLPAHVEQRVWLWGGVPATDIDNAMLCLRSEDAFVITCVANLMEVKVLYVQQDLRYEIYSYWRFNV